MRVSNVKFAAWTKPPPLANEVARNGKWKLMALDGSPVGLYDLRKDPSEKVNLLTKEKEITQKLLSELKLWKLECEKEVLLSDLHNRLFIKASQSE